MVKKEAKGLETCIVCGEQFPAITGEKYTIRGKEVFVCAEDLRELVKLLKIVASGISGMQTKHPVIHGIVMQIKPIAEIIASKTPLEPSDQEKIALVKEVEDLSQKFPKGSQVKIIGGSFGKIGEIGEVQDIKIGYDAGAWHVFVQVLLEQGIASKYPQNVELVQD